MDEILYRKFYEVEDRHWWFRGRQKLVLDALRQWLNLNPQARLLDVGCGTGGTLKFLSDHFDAWGIDSSPLAIDLCHNRGLTQARQLATTELKDQFDVITLLDVIEHIEDDAGFLRDCLPLLTTGGAALITGPAFPALWSAHDEVNHHKRRYTPETLRAAIERAGFDVMRMTFFNTLLFPLGVAERALARLRKTNAPSAALSLPPAPVNRLLERIFSSERFLIRGMKLPFGISLMAAARKR